VRRYNQRHVSVCLFVCDGLTWDVVKSPPLAIHKQGDGRVERIVLLELQYCCLFETFSDCCQHNTYRTGCFRFPLGPTPDSHTKMPFLLNLVPQ